MKKITHVLLMALLLVQVIPSDLFAKKITAEQAKQQAYSFWSKEMPQKARAKCRQVATAGVVGANKTVITDIVTATQGGESYYVFNNDAGGFVIIAGDDAVNPVLGYASTGSFDAKSLPDGLKDLLASYNRQIVAIGNTAKANQAKTFVGQKLLSTAKWNQTTPFNKYIPGNYVAGCVATAGAIVMKHHGFPSRGKGSHSYVWNGQSLSANFEHDYDWTGMPAYYDGTNSDAFDGVARLMADLGVAVEMNYTRDGSGASLYSLAEAMKTYFGYSKYTRLTSIDYVGAEGWSDKLRAEIDANRPVLYSATDANGGGGHAFVIDGYQNDAFSVNWGWGGYCDGFYVMGALDPKGNNGETGEQYNIGQAAVFGLEPSDGTEKISPLTFYHVDGCLDELNMGTENVKQGQRFPVYLMPVLSQADQAFSCELGVALLSADGQVKEIMGSTSIKELQPGYYYSSITINCQSSVDAQAGDYVAVVTKEADSNEYVEVTGQDFEKVRMSAVGYEPKTFELRTHLDEGATFIEAPATYNWGERFYKGKPLMGAPYYFDVNIESGFAKSFVEMDGKEPSKARFSDGAEFYFISRGVKPVYDLVVKNYKVYEEKNVALTLSEPGQLKTELERLGLDYYVYKHIKVDGNIDQRDFEELNAHSFKSIDLSGSTVVAYGSSEADAIPEGAFWMNTALQHFKMPKGVVTLGVNAFRQTGLQDIDLPATIRNFGLNTFWGCHSLADVYMHHQEAPSWISWCVFYNKGNEVSRTLHLYPGCKAKYEAYQYTQNWIVNFDAVVEDLTTGILRPTLSEKNKNSVVYDLNGRSLPHTLPSSGLYIQNGKKYIKR